MAWLYSEPSVSLSCSLLNGIVGGREVRAPVGGLDLGHLMSWTFG